MAPHKNNNVKLCIQIIGVRGMPERDIESLGVMGWGLAAGRRFFRRRRRRRRRRPGGGGGSHAKVMQK